jgi:uncharacterized membrane protein YwaF
MSLNRKRSVLLGVALAVILALVVTISVVFTKKEVRANLVYWSHPPNGNVRLLENT